MAGTSDAGLSAAKTTETRAPQAVSAKSANSNTITAENAIADFVCNNSKR
jgi:hypothetical protein